MKSKRVAPSLIMHQIRDAVRNNHASDDNKRIDLLEKEIQPSVDIHLEIESLRAKFSKLEHRVTPHMPVSFIEPRLVSRSKALNILLTPLRKFGNRLFSKWYIDVITNQQKYFNGEAWAGINNSKEVIAEQSKLIISLYNKINELDSKLSAGYSLLEEQSKMMIQHELKWNAFDERFELTEFRYSDFAERFSASGEEVKNIFSQYLRYLKLGSTIVDIGCGRGYFLELLKENSYNGIGVDTDPRLIDICKEKGLEAYVSEGEQFLQDQEEGSIDAIFMAHVIEHLTVPQKISFFRTCYSRLKSGGTLIIETPNTTSVYVMTNLYFLDPTHEKPLFPEALKHLATMEGFSVSNAYLSGEIEGQDKQYYNFSLILKK